MTCFMYLQQSQLHQNWYNCLFFVFCHNRPFYPSPANWISIARVIISLISKACKHYLITQNQTGQKKHLNPKIEPLQRYFAVLRNLPASMIGLFVILALTVVWPFEEMHLELMSVCAPHALWGQVPIWSLPIPPICCHQCEHAVWLCGSYIRFFKCPSKPCLFMLSKSTFCQNQVDV